MNGLAHKRIAMLSYIIVATVPAINSFPLFNNNLLHVSRGISIVGLGLSGLAGLIVDADTQHSKISHMNPVMGAANGLILLVESFIKIVLRLVIGVGLGILILKYSKNIIVQLSTIENLMPYASMITYLMAGILVFSGIANETVIKSIPVVGIVYKKLSNSIRKITNSIKRIAMFLIYAGSGSLLIFYNFRILNDINLYVISALLISIAIFPHRTFLHSIEGTAVFTFSASYFLNKFGYRELTGCFFVGYISHIYWADIFTKEGVPVLSIPRILAELFKKMHVHNVVVKILEKAGDIKLKLPPYISTGSSLGNLFEVIYEGVLLLIALLAYMKFGTVIRVL